MAQSLHTIHNMHCSFASSSIFFFCNWLETPCCQFTESMLPHSWFASKCLFANCYVAQNLHLCQLSCMKYIENYFCIQILGLSANGFTHLIIVKFTSKTLFGLNTASPSIILFHIFVTLEIPQLKYQRLIKLILWSPIHQSSLWRWAILLHHNILIATF